MKLYKDTKEEEKREAPAGEEILELCALVYLTAVAVALPFYCKDGFVLIGDAKSELYFKIALIVGVVSLIGMAVCLAGRIHKKEKIIQKTAFSAPDYLILAYGITVVLSYLLTPYKEFALFGAEDWYMGLITQLTMVFGYFLISRYFNGDSRVVWALCAVSGIIFLLGTLNKFAIDVLGMYSVLDYWNKYHLIATLGNMNWYCGYCCSIFPLGFYLFWRAEGKWAAVASGVYVVFAYSTLLTQGSDSGYLALLLVLAAFCFLSFQENIRMRRFLIMLLLLPVTCLLLRAFLFLRKGINWLAEDSPSEAIIKSQAGLTGTLICLAIVLIFLYAERKKKFYIKTLIKLRNAAAISAGAVLLALLTIVAVHAVSPRTFSFLDRYPLLNFNDMWGTQRGFIWKVALKGFLEMPPSVKLFGAGPDCFAPYLYEHYGDILDGYLRERWGNAAITNAHNEWLTTLINYGVVGTITYVGGLLGCAIRFFRQKQTAPYAVGIAFCVITYIGNQTVSFQQVLATPFFFCLLGIAEAMIRKQNITQKPS